MRYILDVVTILRHFLFATVDIASVRFGANDVISIEPQTETEVRRTRVLRAQRHRHDSVWVWEVF